MAAALLVLWGLPAQAQPEVSGAGDESVHIELYHSEACPHCRTERAFLADLVRRHPAITVTAYELSGSAQNRQRLDAVAAEMGFEPTGVPITIVEDRVWVGFGQETATALEAQAVAALAQVGPAPGPVGPPAVPVGPVGEQAVDAAAAGDVVALPVVGDVDVAQQSLIVSTLLIGFLDGVNPCSLWVLSLLLALVVHTGSRRRVMAVGLVFLTITTLLYGLLIAGVYSVLAVIAYLTWIRIGVAVVAGTMGTVNLLDAFGVALPVRLRIPETRRPGIYRRMRAAARSDGSLAASLGATAALAVGVSLVETPCTAGFPVLWSNLVATSGAAGAQVAGLFGLYMLVFLLDELIVFTLAVVTLRATKLQEAHGAWLKLAGGVVMLALAVVVVVAPSVLESLVGTLTVFGAAALITAVLGLGLRQRLRTARPDGADGPPARVTSAPGMPGPGG